MEARDKFVYDDDDDDDDDDGDDIWKSLQLRKQCDNFTDVLFRKVKSL